MSARVRACRWVLVLAVLGVGVASAGCGGSDASEGAAAQSTPAPTPLREREPDQPVETQPVEEEPVEEEPTTPDTRIAAWGYESERGYQYGFTLSVSNSLADYVQWQPGDPQITRPQILNTPASPVSMVVDNVTPARDAPFTEGASTSVFVQLFYDVGREVTAHAQDLVGPSTRQDPTMLVFTFSFGGIEDVTIPEGSSVELEPFEPGTTGSGIIAGSDQVAEADQDAIMDVLSEPPALIVLGGPNGSGGWLSNYGDVDAHTTKCLAANGDVGVIAAFTGTGNPNPVPCKVVRAAYEHAL